MTTSSIRKNVLEALDVVASKGATRDELVDLIGGDANKRSVAMSLLRCSQDDLVIEQSGRFYLKDYEQKSIKPINGHIEPYVANNRVEVSALAKKRNERTVYVYSSPTESPGIIQLQMCINNQWIKIPLIGNLKICTGPDIPIWSPDQETNYNVTVVRLIKANGQYSDIQVARGYPVTIDYEDEN